LKDFFTERFFFGRADFARSALIASCSSHKPHKLH
jgi:hypothetical protein